jgi:uncharacterized protein YbjT (DUF2867 family)
VVRILVSGGTGSLGSAVVSVLKDTENRVRILSRKPRASDKDSIIEWKQGDVATGAGLVEALADVDIVVNCTGNAQNVYETDVIGVKRLAEMAKAVGVRHFFHISIIGIEHIDLNYYRHKISAENAVMESGIAYSIQRVAQFHTLLDFILSRMQLTPQGYELPLAPDAQFQVIDTYDVAQYILPLLLGEPAGKLPDVGGPAILRFEELARIYLKEQGITSPTFIEAQKSFFPPATVEGFRQGFNTAPINRYGTITWADYVRRKFQKLSGNMP